MKVRPTAHQDELTEREAQRLKERLNAAYPDLTLSDALSHRVASAAEQSERRNVARSLWNGRFRLALALGGASAVLLPVLILWPRSAVSRRRIQNEILDTRSAHIVSWNVEPDGRRIKHRELWYQQGEWRIEEAGGNRITLCAAGRLINYNKSLNFVRIQHKDRPVGYENVSGFTLKATKNDAVRAGFGAKLKEHQERLRETRIEGRDLVEYLTSSALFPLNRSRLWVDVKADLPVRAEIERKENGRWTLVGINEFHFNEVLPSSLFTPNYPSTAHVVDVEAGRLYWQQRLAKGLQRRQVLDRHVVLRDVQVNSEGDVFVLFTRGAPPEQAGDPIVELKDDRGTLYLKPSDKLPRFPLIPTVANETGFLFHGAALEGAYWIPLHPQQLWRPRRFTLTIQVAGPDDLAHFTVQVEKPEVNYTPNYMPYMARGLENDGGDYAVRYQATITRAAYSQYTLHDYKHALELYDRALRMDAEYEREMGSKRFNEAERFAKYETLVALGRHDQARKTLEEAYSREIYDRSMKQKIEAALRKEGVKRQFERDETGR